MQVLASIGLFAPAGLGALGIASCTLIGLEAPALAWAAPASLVRLAALDERQGERAWWPGFEREFWRCAEKRGGGAQRGGS